MGRLPDAGELTRVTVFWLVALAYVALWLALAILVSVLLRRAATAALVTIAVWLVFTLFAGLISGIVADAVQPVGGDATAQEVLDNARAELQVRRLSPDQLYREATSVLLSPSRQSTGLMVVDLESRAVPSTLPLTQSLLLAWWQVMAIVAGAIVVFTLSYVAFLRQEIRA